MGECFLTPKGKAEIYLEHAGLNTGVERWLERIGYFDAPASKGHHLATKGGLVRHSVTVTRRLVALTDALGVYWPRKESPYLVGMRHDLVKCKCYRAINGEMRRRGEASEGSRERSEAPEGPARGRAQDAEPKWEYVQPEYPGHGACSVAIAAELGISSQPWLSRAYLSPLMKRGYIVQTLPKKPKSPLQRYRLSRKGRDEVA